MFTGEPNAVLKSATRAQHPATHVLGITETAQRHRFEVGTISFPGERERRLVRTQTAVQVTSRKQEIAA
jgi:hypothetical protein